MGIVQVFRELGHAVAIRILCRRPPSRRQIRRTPLSMRVTSSPVHMAPKSVFACTRSANDLEPCSAMVVRLSA